MIISTIAAEEKKTMSDSRQTWHGASQGGGESVCWRHEDKGVVNNRQQKNELLLSSAWRA